MPGTQVAFPGNGGQEIAGTLQLPEGSGPWPGVVVAHEVWGPTDYVSEAAAALAAEGFAALVPDLWSRDRAAGRLPPEDADLAAWTAFVETVHHARIVGDLVASCRFLLGRPEVGPRALGTVGFSMGGIFAFHLACERGASIRACVDFYGRIRYARSTPNHPRSPLERVGELQAPVLGIFGGFDALVPLQDVLALKEALGARGHVIAYPRAGHSFLDPAAEAYREDDAEDAWRRALLFLRERLAPETLNEEEGPAVPVFKPAPPRKGPPRGGARGARGGRR